MYDYDYEREKNKKFEPNIELSQKDKAIEFFLVGMTGAALVFFFLKVMFF